MQEREVKTREKTKETSVVIMGINTYLCCLNHIEASRLLNVNNITRRLKRKKPFELVGR
jgi:hypothetical protein